MFIQPDWWEVTKRGVGTNRYSYSFGDPANKMDPGGNDAGYAVSAEDWDPLTNPPTASNRTWGQDMADVAAATGQVAGEVAKVALPDVQELTDGDLSLDDAIEVAGLIPAGKLAKYVSKFVRESDLARGFLKSAEDVAENTRNVCSFDEATLVMTRGGLRPIRDVLPGKDTVWGLDTNGEGGWHAVLRKTVRTYDHRVLVTIRDEESGAVQTIISNRIHPYFVQNTGGEIVPAASEDLAYYGPLPNGHWVDAGKLKPGFLLLNPDSTSATVVSVEEQYTSLDAWNLTVEAAHSYFVAGQQDAEPVWVHNACRPSVAEAKDMAKKAGWKKQKEQVHGQAVYYDEKTKNYYSYDKDGHTGGTWKGAKSIADLRSKTTRLGTYDEDLNWIAP